ncbi:MAG: CRISPR system precrRNA processing endoribonuclease RAMP protein Cas6 [Chloroflexi bacterium]|nr:CRISPR system precrRNA processing endoribonuclease RAMP protein Cas6 [Chloroflexota bacterium]
MMHRIAVTFQPTGANRTLTSAFVTGTGLQGLLFEVLKASDPDSATWLHDYAGQFDPTTGRTRPSLYTIVPVFNRNKLQGITINLFTTQARDAVLTAWEQCHNDRRPLHIGKQPLLVDSVSYVSRLDIMALDEIQPLHEMTFQFCRPTAFKSYNNHCVFPLPDKLFSSGSGPVRAWDHFAPAPLRTSQGWLDWCLQDVYVSRHDIRTAVARLNVQAPFIGFIGKVTLRATKNSPETFLRRWHALALVAEYSGFGRKTTMGMGVTQLIND